MIPPTSTFTPCELRKRFFKLRYYADIFFFENNYLDEKTRKEFISHIISRFNVKEKIVLKMNDNNLLAHYIKAEVVEKLRDNNFLLV